MTKGRDRNIAFRVVRRLGAFFNLTLSTHRLFDQLWKPSWPSACESNNQLYILLLGRRANAAHSKRHHLLLDMADDHDFPHQVEVSDEEVSSSEAIESSDVEDGMVEQVDAVSHPPAAPAAVATTSSPSQGRSNTSSAQNPPRAAKTPKRGPRNLEVAVSGPTEDVRLRLLPPCPSESVTIAPVPLMTTFNIVCDTCCLY